MKVQLKFFYLSIDENSRTVITTTGKSTEVSARKKIKLNQENFNNQTYKSSQSITGPYKYQQTRSLLIYGTVL